MQKTKKPPILRQKAGKYYAQMLNQVGKKPSIEGAMIKAGYSPKTARVKQGVVGRSKPFLEEVAKYNQKHLKKLEKLEKATMKQALKTVKSASYRDSITGLDTIQKNKRILQGIQSSEEQIQEEEADVILERIQRIHLKR